MRAPDNSRPAQIELYVGATGTGKSHVMERRARREKSLLVFDTKGEWAGHGCHRIDSPRVLAATLRANDHGRYAYAPPALDRASFNFWCRCAFAWGDALLVVEELPAVTHAGKALGTWGLLLNQGRGFGLRIMASAQRAAEIDKTTIGNATLIHARQMVRAADRAYIAREMDLKQQELDALTGYGFVEYHHRDRAYKRGK